MTDSIKKANSQQIPNLDQNYSAAIEFLDANKELPILITKNGDVRIASKLDIAIQKFWGLFSFLGTEDYTSEEWIKKKLLSAIERNLLKTDEIVVNVAKKYGITSIPGTRKSLKKIKNELIAATEKLAEENLPRRFIPTRAELFSEAKSPPPPAYEPTTNSNITLSETEVNTASSVEKQQKAKSKTDTAELSFQPDINIPPVETPRIDFPPIENKSDAPKAPLTSPKPPALIATQVADDKELKDLLTPVSDHSVVTTLPPLDQPVSKQQPNEDTETEKKPPFIPKAPPAMKAPESSIPTTSSSPKPPLIQPTPPSTTSLPPIPDISKGDEISKPEDKLSSSVVADQAQIPNEPPRHYTVTKAPPPKRISLCAKITRFVLGALALGSVGVAIYKSIGRPDTNLPTGKDLTPPGTGNLNVTSGASLFTPEERDIHSDTRMTDGEIQDTTSDETVVKDIPVFPTDHIDCTNAKLVKVSKEAGRSEYQFVLTAEPLMPNQIERQGKTSINFEPLIEPSKLSKEAFTKNWLGARNYSPDLDLTLPENSGILEHCNKAYDRYEKEVNEYSKKVLISHPNNSDFHSIFFDPETRILKIFHSNPQGIVGVQDPRLKECDFSVGDRDFFFLLKYQIGYLDGRGNLQKGEKPIGGTIDLSYLGVSKEALSKAIAEAKNIGQHLVIQLPPKEEITESASILSSIPTPSDASFRSYEEAYEEMAAKKDQVGFVFGNGQPMKEQPFDYVMNAIPKILTTEEALQNIKDEMQNDINIGKEKIKKVEEEQKWDREHFAEVDREMQKQADDYNAVNNPKRPHTKDNYWATRRYEQKNEIDLGKALISREDELATFEQDRKIHNRNAERRVFDSKTIKTAKTPIKLVTPVEKLSIDPQEYSTSFSVSEDSLLIYQLVKTQQYSGSSRGESVTDSFKRKALVVSLNDIGYTKEEMIEQIKKSAQEVEAGDKQYLEIPYREAKEKSISHKDIPAVPNDQIDCTKTRLEKISQEPGRSDYQFVLTAGIDEPNHIESQGKTTIDFKPLIGPSILTKEEFVKNVWRPAQERLGNILPDEDLTKREDWKQFLKKEINFAFEDYENDALNTKIGDPKDFDFNSIFFDSDTRILKIFHSHPQNMMSMQDPRLKECDFSVGDRDLFFLLRYQVNYEDDKKHFRRGDLPIGGTIDLSYLGVSKEALSKAIAEAKNIGQHLVIQLPPREEIMASSATASTTPSETSLTTATIVEPTSTTSTKTYTSSPSFADPRQIQKEHENYLREQERLKKAEEVHLFETFANVARQPNIISFQLLGSRSPIFKEIEFNSEQIFLGPKGLPKLLPWDPYVKKNDLILQANTDMEFSMGDNQLLVYSPSDHQALIIPLKDLGYTKDELLEIFKNRKAWLPVVIPLRTPKPSETPASATSPKAPTAPEVDSETRKKTDQFYEIDRVTRQPELARFEFSRKSLSFEEKPLNFDILNSNSLTLTLRPWKDYIIENKILRISINDIQFFMGQDQLLAYNPSSNEATIVSLEELGYTKNELLKIFKAQKEGGSVSIPLKKDSTIIWSERAYKTMAAQPGQVGFRFAKVEEGGKKVLTEHSFNFGKLFKKGKSAEVLRKELESRTFKLEGRDVPYAKLDDTDAGHTLKVSLDRALTRDVNDETTKEELSQPEMIPTDYLIKDNKLQINTASYSEVEFSVSDDHLLIYGLKRSALTGESKLSATDVEKRIEFHQGAIISLKDLGYTKEEMVAQIKKAVSDQANAPATNMAAKTSLIIPLR